MRGTNNFLPTLPIIPLAAIARFGFQLNFRTDLFSARKLCLNSPEEVQEMLG